MVRWQWLTSFIIIPCRLPRQKQKHRILQKIRQILSTRTVAPSTQINPQPKIIITNNPTNIRFRHDHNPILINNRITKIHLLDSLSRYIGTSKIPILFRSPFDRITTSSRYFLVFCYSFIVNYLDVGRFECILEIWGIIHNILSCRWLIRITKIHPECKLWYCYITLVYAISLKCIYDGDIVGNVVVEVVDEIA